MVGPTQQRHAIVHLVDRRLCSQRRACRLVGLHRSTFRYEPIPPSPRQIQLHQRIVALSWAHPRYGYRRIRARLSEEGWTVSRKQVQRIRRMAGLKVRSKPKKIARRGHSTGLPTKAVHRNQVWTWDFILTGLTKAARSRC
jgi:putative transposase